MSGLFTLDTQLRHPRSLPVVVLVVGGALHTLTASQTLIYTNCTNLQTMDAIKIDLPGCHVPGLEHQGIRYVFHVCRLRDVPSRLRLIEFEGIENVEDPLANYTDKEPETLADRNSKQTPVASRVQLGPARTILLKAISPWVQKKLREGVECNLHELTPALIAQLTMEIYMTAVKKDADSKFLNPVSFSATNYKNWIKKVENYLDSRTGKLGVPFCYGFALLLALTLQIMGLMSIPA